MSSSSAPAPPAAFSPNRLSADSEARVLLLEAGGPDKKLEIQAPAAFSKLFKTELDWDYETEPQSELADRRLYWPRGKMLGGCSSMNAMIYIRGHRRDYDDWAAAGNPGWGYDDVLPYFKRSENFEPGANAHHGAGGPLNVTRLRDTNPASLAYVEAAVEAGLARNDDFNGTVQAGAGLYHVTQKGGRRCSAARAFLHPAMKRANLTVETRALATSVFFSREDRAVGVRYRKNGGEQEVRAQPGCPLRRSDQLATASVAFGHRPGGRSRETGDRSGA